MKVKNLIKKIEKDVRFCLVVEDTYISNREDIDDYFANCRVKRIGYDIMDMRMMIIAEPKGKEANYYGN